MNHCCLSSCLVEPEPCTHDRHSCHCTKSWASCRHCLESVPEVASELSCISLPVIVGSRRSRPTPDLVTSKEIRSQVVVVKGQHSTHCCPLHRTQKSCKQHVQRNLYHDLFPTMDCIGLIISITKLLFGLVSMFDSRRSSPHSSSMPAGLTYQVIHAAGA